MFGQFKLNGITLLNASKKKKPPKNLIVNICYFSCEWFTNLIGRLSCYEQKGAVFILIIKYTAKRGFPINSLIYIQTLKHIIHHYVRTFLVKRQDPIFRGKILFQVLLFFLYVSVFLVAFTTAHSFQRMYLTHTHTCTHLVAVAM